MFGSNILHKAHVFAADEEVRSYFTSSSIAKIEFSSSSPLSSSNNTTPSPCTSLDFSKKYKQVSLTDAFQFGKKLKQSKRKSAIDQNSKSKKKCVDQSAFIAKVPSFDSGNIIKAHLPILPLVKASNIIEEHILSGNQRPLGVDIISVKTAAELISGSSYFRKQYDQVHVLDCRFDFEYSGGHIDGALHITSPYELLTKYFESLETGSKICILFHCEYSQERGPSMWKIMRELDRNYNGIENFPRLFYPEMYIIEGGYKEFFKQYPSLCSPQNYISMDDPKHSAKCKESFSNFRRSIKQFKQEKNVRTGTPSESVCSSNNP